MIKLLVLGTAQDGGVPHLGCTQFHCERARRDTHYRRWVACLGLVDVHAGYCALVDATPDIREQLDYLGQHPDVPPAKGRNPVDGVILTHAHIGHYTGLVQFGDEVLATRDLPVYCTESMARFLTTNAPWAQLVRRAQLRVQTITHGQTVRLTDRLHVRPYLVPHRHEWSDTIGIEIIGPRRRALYIPDIDRWDAWDRDIYQEALRCDFALLDGCFYSADEVPGRRLEEVSHPLVPDTVRRLARLRLSYARMSPPAPALVAPATPAIYFTHLNHTNPVLDCESPERREVESNGFQVAEDRMEFEL